MTTRLTRLDREMDRNAILHDQMRKDHLKGLKDLGTNRVAHDHERQLQGR